MLNILLAGVGGQGTVLASKLIAKSAIARGETAHTAETIGMAQRGGCVVSHVRIGEDVIAPLIPMGQADVIIGFEPAEAVRALPYLKENGVVVVSNAPVKPVTDSLSDTSYDADVMLAYLQCLPNPPIVVDAQAVIAACGSAKSLNIALLGAAAQKNVIGISLSALEEVVCSTLAPKFRESNQKALAIGAASVK